MPIVNTSTLTPKSRLTISENTQIYCGLDSCVTLEVFEELNRTYSNDLEDDQPSRIIYNFERALQAPYLEIMQRGFLVDDVGRQEAAQILHSRIDALQATLNEFAFAVWDKPLNPRSPVKLQEFFYGALKLPEVWISQKGQRKLSTNREALEKLSLYLYARPFVSLILGIRDLAKQLEIFETSIDGDLRFRAAYNIAGTETGRPSSSENAFGTGRNAQNIAPGLRWAFVADPGWKMCVIDLEQVEARDCGFFIGCLFDDWRFLDACECLTGDHEVLTPFGWERISSKPQEIATWGRGREIKFEKVQRWNEGESRELVSAENRSISLLGTLNHRMPIIYNRRVEIRTLSEIAEHPNFTAPNTGFYRTGYVSVKEVELLAAFQADGTRDEKGRVHWSFIKSRKIEIMRQLLTEFKYNFSEYDLGSGATRFYLHMGQGQENWKKECGPEILSWDYETLKKFCSSHSIWDGCWEGSILSIVSKSKEHIDWLATAYTLVGKAVTINVHKREYWELNIRTMDNYQYRSATIERIKLEQPAPVFCPTVSSGFFMVRRNGKIFISGNSGDLHTANSRLIWPDLPWTGELARDRKIAEGQFYREFSYRDFGKKGGHLTHYFGTPWTASRVMKVPIVFMEDFRKKYVTGGILSDGSEVEAAYPGFPLWWQWTATELQTVQQLITPFGRRRHFFGRPGDDTTLREAIAFLPQSTTADRMNLGMWRVWKKLPNVQLLAQTYDSITFQYQESANEAQIIEDALALVQSIPLTAPNGRRYTVPGEAKIGWNWGARVTQDDIDRAIASGKKPPRLNPRGLHRWRKP